ncbi:substance-K receptor-like [Oculina patagonica]
MSRLGYLILACCVWIAVAEENISNRHNETDHEKDPHYTADIKYSRPTKVIFTSAMLFTFLVSVIGNSLVIYVITKHHSMRTSTNCLIMNLAVCDLLTTMFLTPSFIKHLFAGDTWFGGMAGSLTCKIFAAFGLSVLLFCSVFNFIAIAVDRFLAVTRPLTYKLQSRWLVKIGIPVIWLISALLSIKSIMSAKIDYYGEDVTPRCTNVESHSEEAYMSVSCLVASLVVLIVLYSIIAFRLWRRNIPGEVSSNQHALAFRTARKVTVLMISVVLVFVVSWAPAFAYIILYYINGNPISITAMQYPFLFTFTYWLVSNSSACNPVIYFIFIESFRKRLKTACSRCCAPQLRLSRIGQERRFETAESIGNRQPSNVFTKEEGNIELTTYRPINHRFAPL